MAPPGPVSGSSSGAPGGGSGLAGTGVAVAPLPEPEIVEDRRRNADGTVQIRKYTKGAFLGKGGFAKCYAFTAMNKQRTLAGKVIPKTTLVKPRAKAKLMTEIKIHRELCHDKIVKFESFFEDKVNVYILLELCTNHTMMEMVKGRRRLTENEARYFMLQLIDATRYLHHHNVIHRDLKLGNLFLSKDMTIKLGDFGLAAQLVDSGERKKTICGTPNYIAPEVLDNKSGHSFEVDVWSIGVILYTILVGKPPFETSDIKATYKRIRMNQYSFPDGVVISDDARNLIESILQTDPTCRPTLDAMLSHPFFTRPGAMVPRRLSSSALFGAPSFGPGDLMPAALAASELLARPIDGLRPKTRPAPDLENMLPTGTTEGSGKEHAVLPGSMPSRRVSEGSLPGGAGVSGGGGAASAGTGGPSSTGAGWSSTGVGGGASAGASGVAFSGVLAPKPSVTNCPDRTSRVHTYSTRGASSGVSSTTAAPLPITMPSTMPTARGDPRGDAREGMSCGSAGTPSAGAPEFELVHTGRSASTKPASAAYPPPAPRVAEPDRVELGEADALRCVHDRLLRTIDLREEAGKDSPTSGSCGAPATGPGLWISTWVDYTTKYGLGYLLSNGAIGVYFNDSTKIVLASDGERFEYHERAVEGAEGALSHSQAHTLSSFPHDLTKKVTLLKHFRGYLLQQYSKQEYKCPEEVDSIARGSTSANMPYVKKWVRTRHAVLFRLSNRTVQINFFDQSAIVLSNTNQITYVNKDGTRSHHYLSSVVCDSRPDILKRLKYTKDILGQLTAGSSR